MFFAVVLQRIFISLSDIIVSKMGNWFIKYRIEFTLIMSAVATLCYALSAPLFLIYSPEKSLLLSLSVALLASGVSLVVAHPTLSLRVLPLAPLRGQICLINDFFVWFAFALYTSVWLMLLIFPIIFGLKYYRQIVAARGQELDTEFPKLRTRVMNTLLIYMLSLCYISAIKSYLIADRFSIQSSVVVVVLAYLAIYVVQRNRLINRVQESEND